MEQEGWWATHKYHRASVARDITEFIGWNFLEKLVALADKEWVKALICTLFLTGGRISEVLMLRKHHLVLSEKDFIIVRAMPVVKTASRKGMTRRRYRTFPIKRTEPLAPIFLKHVESSRGLLFPSRYRKRASKNLPITQTRSYQIVHALGHKLNIHIYNHWFRAQRASQLASEHDFKLHDLMQYFAWLKMETALRYAHLGWRDLAKKMT